MKGFVKQLLFFFIPVLLVVIAVFLMPLDKQFAYNFVKGECSNHGKWIHDRLNLNPAPIDVAIVGTSVGWGLFDDRALSNMLTEEKGKSVNVVNLSYCRPGFNMRALMVEEIIKAKHPKRIVIEIRRKPSRGGHHLYGFLATTEMMLNPATRLYQPFYTDLKNAVIVRWEKIRGLVFPGKAYVADRSKYGGSPNDVLVDQGKMEWIREKRRQSDPFKKETLQETIHYYVYWKNMEYIKQLCEESGVALSFFYVNEFGMPVEQPKYIDRLEEIAPIWYAPDSIFHNPMLYADVVHFNRDGTNAITPFLFEHLAKYDY